MRFEGIAGRVSFSFQGASKNIRSVMLKAFRRVFVIGRDGDNVYAQAVKSALFQKVCNEGRSRSGM